MKRKNIFNLISKVICVMLCVVTCLTSVACDKGASTGGMKEIGYLIDDGICEYSIVLSNDAKDGEKKAASEFQQLIKMATGVDIPVIFDNAVIDKTKVISIGETTLSVENSFLGETSLGDSGYKIKTIGASLYIIGDPVSEGLGCVYGVYDVLEDLINYKAFAADEIQYDKTNTVPLYEYDTTYVPSMEFRRMNWKSINNDSTYALRLKLTQSDAIWGGITMHAQVYHILKHELYLAEHPDWYNSSKDQLCWMSGCEKDENGNWVVKAEDDPTNMYRAFANEVIKMLEKYPSAKFIRMGQEDIGSLCVCNKCMDAIKTYKNSAGLQIIFANQVIKYVEEWREVHMPERDDISYVVYAYHSTEKAPVELDESGKYQLVHEDLIPHEKLGIYYAAIGTDYSYNFEAQQNKAYLENLQGWGAITDNIIVFGYDSGYIHLMGNFNNFGTKENFYRHYVDNNVRYISESGNTHTLTPQLEEMRMYVQSQLAWDVTQSYDDLVTEFFNAYYKQAAGSIRKYYDFMRSWYAMYLQIYKESLGHCYADLTNSQLWPKGVVDQLDAHLEEALNDIASLEQTDPELYVKLKNRIKRISLSTTYIQLLHYQSYYSQEEKLAMKEDFRYYAKLWNITHISDSVELNADDLFGF